MVTTYNDSKLAYPSAITKLFHLNRDHFLDPSDMDISSKMTLNTKYVVLDCAVSYRSLCFPPVIFSISASCVGHKFQE